MSSATSTHSSRMPGTQGLGRGPVRGPGRRIIPAPRVPSARWPVLSVQLAHAQPPRVPLVMRRPLDDDEDQGDEVPTVVRDPGRFARCMPDRRVNAGNWRSLPDSPIPYPTWDTQADPLRRATTCSTVLSDHPKLRRRCAGSAHYARLRSWTVARRSHGTVRGTTRRITPAQQVPSVRRPVQSVQLVRVMHGAVVLIIRRSWVRAPPAPPGGLHVSVGTIFTFRSDILVRGRAGVASAVPVAFRLRCVAGWWVRACPGWFPGTLPPPGSDRGGDEGGPWCARPGARAARRWRAWRGSCGGGGGF